MKDYDWGSIDRDGFRWNVRLTLRNWGLGIVFGKGPSDRVQYGIIFYLGPLYVNLDHIKELTGGGNDG